MPFFEYDGVLFIVLFKKNIGILQHKICCVLMQEKRHRRRVRVMTNNARPTKLDIYVRYSPSKSHRMRDKIKWMNNRTDWELLNYMNFDMRKKTPFFTCHFRSPYIVVNINIYAHRYISQSFYGMLLMMALNFDFDRFK